MNKRYRKTRPAQGPYRGNGICPESKHRVMDLNEIRDLTLTDRGFNFADGNPRSPKVKEYTVLYHNPLEFSDGRIIISKNLRLTLDPLSFSFVFFASLIFLIISTPITRKLVVFHAMLYRAQLLFSRIALRTLTQGQSEY